MPRRVIATDRSDIRGATYLFVLSGRWVCGRKNDTGEALYQPGTIESLIQSTTHLT